MITPLYIAALGLLFLALSVRTLLTRRRLGIGIGDNGEPVMLRAIRVHGNFAEYVPISLLAMASTEAVSAPPWLVHGLGLALFAGRALHAWGVAQPQEDYRFRVAGMALTLTVLATACLTVLVLWAAPTRAESDAAMNLDDSYNFRRVTDAVTTSGIVPEAALSALEDGELAAVINLLPSDHDHAVTNEQSLVEASGAEYIHIPIPWTAPTSEHFAAFSAAMDRLDGRRVHIHCAANWRVSAFYSTWAVNRGELTLAEADALIADLWNPAEHPAWDDLIRELRKPTS